MDPVEKKPLYHFMPGTSTLSIGSPGCNLTCLGCQNHLLSRPGPDYDGEPPPHDIINGLVRAARAQGAGSVSLTYSEPTVFFEYAADIGKAALGQSLPVIWVTNGSMSPEILPELSLAAMNIDLKGFTEEFYRTITGGALAPVMGSIERALELGIWVEVTTLLIPGLNDSDDALRAMAAWLASLSKDLPWHLSRFFPRHKQKDVPATPLSSMTKARDIGAGEGLRHIYLGNVPGEGHSDTICPACGKLLVQRTGFSVAVNGLSADGICPGCGASIPGRWGFVV